MGRTITQFLRNTMLSAAVLVAGYVHAAHPLVTEDTFTQGGGNFQLELTFEHSRDRSAGVEDKSTQLAAVLSYGIADDADLIAGIPFLRNEKADGQETAVQRGESDLALDVKWRFYEKDNLSLAFKPGITFPTGNDDKGLGTGRITYGSLIVATIIHNDWAYHLDGGYRRNRNDLDERRDIFHFSAASTFQVLENLRLVAEAGIDTNTDKASDSSPAFLLVGLIYSRSKDVDFDLGIKAGLNKVASDYSALAGVTIRW